MRFTIPVRLTSKMLAHSFIVSPCVGARGRIVCRATSVPQVEYSASSVYQSLLESSGTTSIVEMRPSTYQNGLFTRQAVKKDDVLMTVPRGISLIIDYSSDSGLSVPRSGAWPRLKDGLAFEEPLTWDLLLSLALLDGLAGDGGSFWQAYCQHILPAPKALTLPMCWSTSRLEELQHKDIIDAALQQQARLTAMFPGLMEPISEDSPSWFQWAFACVRSRALQLGPDTFAVAPFLDLANHGVQANSDFRLEPSSDGSGGIQLFALKDLPGDTEVLISYTGPLGFTNQRLMAQYGFVLQGGNPGDRVPLQANLKNGVKGLSLERIQSLMGDPLFLEAISGQNAYGYAAMKSMPIVDENSEAGESAPSGAEDRDLARSLVDQCNAMLEGCTSDVREDEDILSQLCHRETSGTSGEAAPDLTDGRKQASIAYRIERKKLVMATRAILQLYCDGS